MFPQLLKATHYRNLVHLGYITLILFSVYSIISVGLNRIINCVELVKVTIKWLFLRFHGWFASSQCLLQALTSSAEMVKRGHAKTLHTNRKESRQNFLPRASLTQCVPRQGYTDTFSFKAFNNSVVILMCMRKNISSISKP